MAKQKYRSKGFGGITPYRRGPEFVLNKGTRVIGDKRRKFQERALQEDSKDF